MLMFGFIVLILVLYFMLESFLMRKDKARGDSDRYKLNRGFGLMSGIFISYLMSTFGALLVHLGYREAPDLSVFPWVANIFVVIVIAALLASYVVRMVSDKES